MENEQVIANLSSEYFFLVFIAALGVLQISVAYGGMKGLSFFTRTRHSLIFAALTVIPTLVGLFTWNQRNPTAIVEGYQQFYLFSLAVFIAFIFNIVLSHLLQRRLLRDNDLQFNGLETLKEATFFQSLKHSFRGKQ